MPAHPGKGHAFPYFKVQVHDRKTLAWKDHRKQAFENETSARRYQATLGDDLQTRVVRWDKSGPIPLEN